MLKLWEPFAPVKRVGAKNIFDSFFKFDDMFDMFGLNQNKNEDGTTTVDIDLPGIKEEDVSINLSDGIITIKGERKTATSSYSVNKSFSLPENCNEENIVAKLKDGVLTLTLTSKQLPEVKEPKQIPINK